MKKIKISLVTFLTAALTAMMAVASVGAASATAAPEFKATAFPVEFTSKNKMGVEPTLHSSALGETNVNCKTSADTGQIKTSTTISGVTVDYTGCKEGTTTNACTTAGEPNAGEIKTNVLSGRVGYLLPRSGKLSGIELEPTSGKVFAEFTCVNLGKVTVEGCTIGEALPLNVSQTTGTLLFEEVSKKQKWVEIEGGTHKPCKQEVSAFGGFIKAEGWLTDQEEEKFNIAVELKA